MDDAVGGCRALAQPVEIVERTRERLCSQASQAIRRGGRAGQPGDPVPRRQQLRYDGGPGQARASSDEHVHEIPLEAKWSAFRLADEST